MAPNRTDRVNYALPHIRVEQFRRDNVYSPPPRRMDETGRTRDNHAHGASLAAKFSSAYARARDAVAQRRIPGLGRVPGVYLELTSAPNQPLGDLTWEQKGIRLSALRSEGEVEKAAIFVPEGADAFVSERLDRYALPVEAGKKASLQDKFSSLDNVTVGSLRSLWADSRPFPESDSATLWWECWVWSDGVAAFERAAASIEGLLVSTQRLIFPEVQTIPIYGDAERVSQLVLASGVVERVRNATDSPSFFTVTVRRDQNPWVDDLRERTTPPEEDCPAVCILDSGVAQAHPLLSLALAPIDCLSVNPSWGTADDHGHGTKMAGTILYEDLTMPLADTREIDLSFKLESVKFLAPPGFKVTDPENYGSITQAAVSIAEIHEPHRRRIFCMAVTNNDISGEDPTSWSAALDQAAAGAMVGDRQDVNLVGPRRLIFVSAGNIPDSSDPDQVSDIDEFPVEDPAQAWNVVTVGGFTEKTAIDAAGYGEWTAVAEAGDLSPYSRISTDWEHSRTPIKPEIVFEAGNKAISPEGNELLSGIDSLSLLTTNDDFTNQSLTTFWATSAATAQAAGMAGTLAATLPSLWDETVRALMVHSARWTPAMLKRLDEAPTKKQKVVLARHFGYGVPSLRRALASAENDLVLLAQRELIPFQRIREENAQGQNVLKAASFKQIDYYGLPWPIKSLEELGEKEVTLKITLSYFIEPSPTWEAARVPQQYQSFGFRFDLKRAQESERQFYERVNNLERNGQPRQAAAQDDGWIFGSQSIAAGSLHCDVWRGTAAKLAARDKIAIFPVGGWWRERTKLGRHSAATRYALAVSISSEEEDVRLYSEISNMISINA